MEELLIFAIRKIKMPRYFAFGLGMSVVIYELAVPSKYKRI